MSQQFSALIRPHAKCVNFRWIAATVSVGLLLLLAACGGGGSSGGIFVTISPASTSVVVGKTIQFSAAVANTSNQTVTWQVNGTTGGDAAHGMITTGGMYTAPAAVPNPAVVTVTAISEADSNQSDSAAVTIVATSAFSDATLNGAYAFSFSGQNNSGFVAAAGSFTADGNGNITNGREDINSGTGVFNPTFTGTYSIHADGRGTVTQNLTNPTQTVVWQIAMMNNSHGLFIRFDSGVATASGTIDKQTAAAFSNASFNGSYIANFSGIGTSLLPSAQAGALSFDGGGNIVNGVVDINDGGAVQQSLGASGTYSIAATGRGTMSLTSSGTQSFAVYVVDSNQLKVVELDSTPALVGDLMKGAGTPGNGSLNGTYAFTVAGASASGPLGIGGIFAANGTGGISSGTLDINDGSGSPLTGQTLGSSSYSIGGNGRGTVTLNLSAGTLQYAVYPMTNGNAVLLDLSSSAVSSGVAYAQSGLPFGSSALQGGFALNWAGALFNSLTLAFDEEDIAGQLTGDAVNNLSGSLDINVNGSTSTAPTTGGSATVATSGRGTMTVQIAGATFNHQIYVVDANTILILDVDGVRVLVGVLKRQS